MPQEQGQGPDTVSDIAQGLRERRRIYQVRHIFWYTDEGLFLDAGSLSRRLLGEIEKIRRAEFRNKMKTHLKRHALMQLINLQVLQHTDIRGLDAVFAS